MLFDLLEHKQNIATIWEEVNQRTQTENRPNLGASKPKSINRI
jgi:hypothetical protein